MKKILIILLASSILSGCVTYKFVHGKSPYDKGYVVTRSGYQITEYTLGKDNSVPDIDVAKERFKRRKKTVESYYKKMGIIEGKLKEYFWDPPVTIVKVIGGIFRLPFIMANERKYEKDPKYRAQIDKEEEEEFEKEKAHIQSLREDLSIYVKKDLLIEEKAPETPPPAVAAPAPAPVSAISETTQPAAVAPAAPVAVQVTPASTQVPTETPAPLPPAPVETKPPEVLAPPVPVIIARPMKGFSPLKVQFYGTSSHSPNGKIISYEWDFGDGDTSKLAKPINTFLSATYGSRVYTVTLTVKDSKAQSASTTANIEVLNK